MSVCVRTVLVGELLCVLMCSLVMKEGSECERRLAGTVSEFELNVDRVVTKALKTQLKVICGV